MRNEHTDQVERWAEYCRSHSDWKKHLVPFIDSQIIIANRFYRRLSRTKEGKRKIMLLRQIQNPCLLCKSKNL